MAVMKKEKITKDEALKELKNYRDSLVESYDSDPVYVMEDLFEILNSYSEEVCKEVFDKLPIYSIDDVLKLIKVWTDEPSGMDKIINFIHFLEYQQNYYLFDEYEKLKQIKEDNSIEILTRAIELVEEV